MMVKHFFKAAALAAVLAMISVLPAAAEECEEMIPMEELNIQEDPDWSEDGEGLIDGYGDDMKDSGKFTGFRYLSSGVNAAVFISTERQGIDVSHHQGVINWSQVKACGMDFAMIRVGYRGYGSGAIYADDYFETNIRNALAAGMKVGIYFFSQALNEQEAREEASYTIQMIQKYNITYPVVFDWETAPGYRTYDAGLTKSQMNSLADTFCSMVSDAGYIPMVYANESDFTNRFDYSALSAKYYIWYARYIYPYGGTTWYYSGGPLPNTSLKYNMWQYMSDGTVPGINGNCDVNVTFLDFGTYAKKEVELSASSEKIEIDESHLTVTGMAAETKYSDLRACFADFNVAINGNSPSAAVNETLKTGDTLTFTPRSANTYLKNSTYTLVIKGDVDGNGRIDVMDMEGIQKSLLKLSTLDTIHLMAARLSGNEDLSVLDMEAIQRHILGLVNLYQ